MTTLLGAMADLQSPKFNAKACDKYINTVLICISYKLKIVNDKYSSLLVARTRQHKTLHFQNQTR